MDKKIFRGGKVVLPDRVLEASLVVEGEKIAGLLHPGTELGAEYEVIDVAGKVLMPGVIDSHVHMWDPSPQNYREDWKCGSRCAASGGITTIIDMPLSVRRWWMRGAFRLNMRLRTGIPAWISPFGAV